MGHSESSKQYPIAVILRVREPKKTVAFYRDTLGFEMKESWPNPEAPMWANLVLDGQSIMLGADLSPEESAHMCGGDETEAAHMRELAQEFRANKPGVGIAIYLRVPDVDAFHGELSRKGIRAQHALKTQFYGQRDFGVQDPDGYRLIFYMPVKLASCQSCSMPLSDAEPGQMFCAYCVDEQGELKPYEAILEGCISGYFIPMQKMTRPQAEQAAREMLSKQPAWMGRG